MKQKTVGLASFPVLLLIASRVTMPCWEEFASVSNGNLSTSAVWQYMRIFQLQEDIMSVDVGII